MDATAENISISKDQLAQLPIVAFPGTITVVDNETKTQEALRILNDQKIVGFDTETKPNFHKGQNNLVALIQLSTLQHSFLFRINKIGFTQELLDFLENPDIIKVGLSLKDDFHNLHKISPFEPHGFIELQESVKEYGIIDASLQRIYGIIFGSRISKAQRLSNWEADTLSASQQSYASIDAWACLQIYQSLTMGQFDPAKSPYHQPETPNEI